jgi:hypothetical protein
VRLVPPGHHVARKATGSLREVQWADSATEQTGQDAMGKRQQACSPIEPIPRRLDRK